MPLIEELSRTSLLQEPTNEKSPNDWEIALLFLQSDSIKKSLPYLRRAMQTCLNEKNFSSYCSVYSLLVQALYELGEKTAVQELQKEFQEIEKTYKLSEKALTLAIYAYYNIYIEKNYEETKRLLSKALKLSFEDYDKCIQTGNLLKQTKIRPDIISCLHFYSIYYMETKDYENAEQEIKNTKILLKDYLSLKEELELKLSQTNNSQELQVYNQILEELKKNNSYYIPNIHLGLKFMESQLELKYKKNHLRAEKLLWELYEDSNKIKHPFLTPYILCSMSSCYLKMGNKKQALIFFNLAQKRANPDRKILFLHFEELQKYFGKMEKTENYDLIFDTKNHLIVEKQKGCVELKNQFILMDLLNLFVLNPGTSYSKEQIIQKVWKQDYLPETHDNKIYVTIKRLREMIEVDSCKPQYICRNTYGYHFSKSAKVLVRQ